MTRCRTDGFASDGETVIATCPGTSGPPHDARETVTIMKPGLVAAKRRGTNANSKLPHDAARD